jgi:F-type H+-transporting ATPase subunit b
MVLLAAENWLDNPETWVGVAFALLVIFALRQGVTGFITKSLDERAAGIKNDIDEARRLRDEAQALLDDSKRKHANATTEANAIVANAKLEAEALAQAARKALQEGLDRRTAQAEEKIARAEAQAIAEVRSTSVNVAVAAAERLIKEKIGSVGSTLLDQGIRDLKGRLN